MKNSLLITILVLIWGCSKPSPEHESDGTTEHQEYQDHSAHESSTASNKPKSPAQMAMANVGDSHVHIEYNAPSKRGRTIFGGLVAYGEVWVTGAHNATSINFSEDVEIGGVIVPKGKYGLFTIPGEKEWTVIINTKWDQHLADNYDPSEDVVRVTTAPSKLNEPVEMLTYEVLATGDKKGKVSINWDQIMVSFEVVDL